MPPAMGPPERRGRPAWLLLALTILAFLVLLGLGTWQIERLQWKEALVAARHAAVTAPAIDPPADLATARGLEFRHIRVAGRFVHDKELYVGATSEQGLPGYFVVTPLARPDGSTLLVNRGWIPEARRNPATRAAGQVEGPVTVEGLLRLPPEGRPSWFIPDNSPTRNYWFYVDVPAMADAAGLARVLPYYIDADNAPNPGGLPIGGQTRLTLPNDHLQYAITWYALALALVVIYFLYRRRERLGTARDPG